MESHCTPEEAAPLIERGAVVDVFAAANLGMFDRLRELVDGDPALVHARGGDGKTPLHCAHTVEIAQYLIDRGADINARDVDHESTPAQYLVREAPEVTGRLIQRGARFDIFIAIGLRDAALVERCLRDDPEALDHRIWHGNYKVAHNGKRAATREEIAIGAAMSIDGSSTTTHPPSMWPKPSATIGTPRPTPDSARPTPVSTM